MKPRKMLFFLLALPLTLVLDFILYALLKNCPSCGSFGQFVQAEGALSFPMVIEITQWLNQLLPKSLKRQRSSSV